MGIFSNTILQYCDSDSVFRNACNIDWAGDGRCVCVCVFVWVCVRKSPTRHPYAHNTDYRNCLYLPCCPFSVPLLARSGSHSLTRFDKQHTHTLAHIGIPFHLIGFCLTYFTLCNIMLCVWHFATWRATMIPIRFAPYVFSFQLHWISSLTLLNGDWIIFVIENNFWG